MVVHVKRSMAPLRYRTAGRAVELLLVALLVGTLSESGGAQERDLPTKQSLDLSTGITMRYVEAGDPAGEPVILLHGITDTSRSFYPMMRHLLQLRPDLHVFALDQRGHGGSSMPPAEACRSAPERCFRPADFAADVLAFMDQKGIERAHLVGHSLGGIVAQELALTHPKRIRRLVLIGTTARTANHPAVKDFLLRELVEGPWREALVRGGHAFPDEVYELTPLDADPDAEAWMAENWVVDPLADSDYLAAITPETARIPLGTWLGAARGLLSVDNTERLKDLTIPTFVIWATQDGIFPEFPDQATLRASLDVAAERCNTGYVWKRYGKKPLPESGLQEDDIGHNVQWGAPEAVAVDLAAYLREDGQPTKDLFYADPGDVHRVLSEPGAAALVWGPAQGDRHCLQD